MVTPSPVPVVTPDPNLAIGLVEWFIGLIIVILVGLVLFGVLLYKSGQLPHPGPIIVSLSLLTAVALVAGIVTSSQQALTLAATGIGALAGAMTAIYRADPGKAEPPAAEGGNGGSAPVVEGTLGVSPPPDDPLEGA
jgi:hypothetical protein